MTENKKVVIIDDEKDLCFLVKANLEETGLYSVLAAYDGSSGKELCLRELPDLIILDFVMPKERGDKVIEFLKNHPETRAIPIILISGLGEMIYFQKTGRWQWLPNNYAVQTRGELPLALKWKKLPADIAKELGITAFLPKPFSGKDLEEVVGEVIRVNQKNPEESESSI
ncbi:MAG TPA: response regulator [Candidatus Omnitrophota bacterium]|nr:response regulator [Candidatus Omnitrophota bacterium]HPD84743.1 response regulator [Candidatus Omnitrophota bacterium]HRZ03601.1 response regulator [Candidatus Omnitrophota bacterium]